MMLADFGGQSSGTSYSMPSSSGTTGAGGKQIPGGKQRSSVISAWVTQIRKRKKKRKKKVADQFDVHHYPDQREKNLTYTSDKNQDGNIEWRRRYERYGLSRSSSDNRDRSELPDYVGHYTIKR